MRSAKADAKPEIPKNFCSSMSRFFFLHCIPVSKMCHCLQHRSKFALHPRIEVRSKWIGLFHNSDDTNKILL